MPRFLPLPLDVDSLLTPMYIRNKLLSLPEGQKLPMSAVEGLSENDGKIEVDSEALMAAVGNLATVSKTGNFDDLANKPKIPSKLSDLTMDVDVATKGDIPTIPSIPSKLSDLTDDVGYAKKSDIPEVPPVPYVPSKLSEFEDDKGYALKSDIPPAPFIPTKLSELDNDPGYVRASQLPNIPVKLSDLPNDKGYITAADVPKVSYPVNSVNGKTGTVTLTVGDIEGLQAQIDAKMTKADLVIRYYTATSNASGVWSVNLGTDFKEVFDVQVTAVSTGSLLAGVRQAAINAYTSASKTLTGMTYGSNTITTILVGGAQGLALIPNTVVRLRVEGR